MLNVPKYRRVKLWNDYTLIHNIHKEGNLSIRAARILIYMYSKHEMTTADLIHHGFISSAKEATGKTLVRSLVANQYANNRLMEGQHHTKVWVITQKGMDLVAKNISSRG